MYTKTYIIRQIIYVISSIMSLKERMHKNMRKKLKLYIPSICIGILGLIFGYTILIPGDKQGENANPLAVMIEQADGSYTLSALNSLKPEGNYVLNEEKTICVNGGKITWNGETATFTGSRSDSCTLYFDEAVDFKIKSVTVNGSKVTTYPSGTGYTVTPTCTGATATWNYSTWALDITSVSSARASCSLAFTSKSNPTYLNQYIIGKSGTTQGASSDAGQIVNENGYRYEGSNPYNYVLFNNELWRIIGVFETTLADGTTKQNLTKIIRNESIGGYAYDKSLTNMWLKTDGTRSSLNILLNDYYYKGKDGTSSGSCYFYSTTVTRNCDYTETGIQSSYQGMVENVTWNLGGYSSATNPNDMYTYERGTTVPSGASATGTGYIGLMYPSDYGYSVLASSCARTTNLSSYSSAACAGKAWMLNYGFDWTITPRSSSSYSVWYVIDDGRVNSNFANHGHPARPVLYLKSNVYIANPDSGNGSISNPYIING